MQETPRVIIYTTPTCHFCQMAKAYFRDQGVEYEEYNVAVDSRAAQEMVQKSGQLGVPVIVVGAEGQEQVIVGFDRPRIEAALGLS